MVLVEQVSNPAEVLLLPSLRSDSPHRRNMTRETRRFLRIAVIEIGKGRVRAVIRYIRVGTLLVA